MGVGSSLGGGFRRIEWVLLLPRGRFGSGGVMVMLGRVEGMVLLRRRGVSSETGKGGAISSAYVQSDSQFHPHPLCCCLSTTLSPVLAMDETNDTAVLAELDEARETDRCVIGRFCFEGWWCKSFLTRLVAVRSDSMVRSHMVLDMDDSTQEGGGFVLEARHSSAAETCSFLYSYAPRWRRVNPESRRIHRPKARGEHTALGLGH